MPDYMILIHSDVPETGPDRSLEWGPYIAALQASGNFQGGSAIGEGRCVRKSRPAGQLSERLAGYIRIQADSLEHAQRLLNGNPGYEAGATVEIRELPRTE